MGLRRSRAKATMAVILSLCHSILYALSRTRVGVFQILIINLGAWIIGEGMDRRGLDFPLFLEDTVVGGVC